MSQLCQLIFPSTSPTAAGFTLETFLSQSKLQALHKLKFAEPLLLESLRLALSSLSPESFTATPVSSKTPFLRATLCLLLKVVSSQSINYLTLSISARTLLFFLKVDGQHVKSLLLQLLKEDRQLLGFVAVFARFLDTDLFLRQPLALEKLESSTWLDNHLSSSHAIWRQALGVDWMSEFRLILQIIK